MIFSMNIKQWKNTFMNLKKFINTHNKQNIVKNIFSKTSISEFERKKRKLSLRSSAHKRLLQNKKMLINNPNMPLLVRQRNDGFYRNILNNNLLIIKKKKAI